MASSQQQPLIYFHSLELENVRCFGERQVLELTDEKGRLGAGFSRGRAGIATKMRYAFGIPRQGCQRRRIPDAMPQRQHTS